MCSEHGYGKLSTDISDYLSCLKIRDEYSSQLESEQKSDIKRRIDEATKQVETSLVSAYSIIAKHSAKNGVEVLSLSQFKDILYSQVNMNLMDLIKSEEWYLEAVGAGLLRRNNLLPEADKNVRVKDVYEAFLRFDDKPMIANIHAVQDSLQRYCMTGEYAIATGEEGKWNNIYFKEVVPMFDVMDETYWLVDKSVYQPVSTESEPPVQGGDGDTTDSDDENDDVPPTKGTPAESGRAIKSIVISGKVPLENYSSLFTSFINPLKDNGIQIEFKISAKSTSSKPIRESSIEYKIAKESAKQLGLSFDEE